MSMTAYCAKIFNWIWYEIYLQIHTQNSTDEWVQEDLY